LPVLEKELDNLTETYDVIALAHSDYDPTLEWVENNLNGDLQIGFSTSDLRDYFKIVGQPITIILDTNGEVILREFGEINFTNF
jgi:thioredoxin-related protein